MVTKTLNGVIHGRTIELADDPGLNEGERVLVELRSREPERTSSNAGHSKGVPAAAVRGLCSPVGVSPPDDAECQRILEDELIRKNSP